MLEIEILLRFVEWLSFWLTNRIARVRVNCSSGKSRALKEGPPQDSVLFPVLFTIHINGLLDQFGEDTLVSAYADDLVIAKRGRNKDIVMAELQKEVDKVAAWSNTVKLTLNTTKFKTSFFGLESAK